MKLELRKKDQVFVLGVGNGQVSKVAPDGSFDVKIAGGEGHYSPEGTVGTSPVQRVFYHDPLVVLPPKNPCLWAAYRKLTKVLFTELMALEAKGEITDVEDN
jgi:hypothetical protein